MVEPRTPGMPARVVQPTSGSSRKSQAELQSSLNKESEEEKFSGDSPITKREQASIDRLQKGVKELEKRLEREKKEASEAERTFRKLEEEIEGGKQRILNRTSGALAGEAAREFTKLQKREPELFKARQRFENEVEDIGEARDALQRGRNRVRDQTARAEGRRAPSDAAARIDQNIRVERDETGRIKSVSKKRVTDADRRSAIAVTRSNARTGGRLDKGTRERIQKVLDDPDTSPAVKDAIRTNQIRAQTRAGIQDRSEVGTIVRAARFNRAAREARIEQRVRRQAIAQDRDASQAVLSRQVLTRRGAGLRFDRPDTAELVRRGVIDPANTATEQRFREGLRRARQVQRARVAEQIGGRPQDVRRDRVDFGIFNNKERIRRTDEQRQNRDISSLLVPSDRSDKDGDLFTFNVKRSGDSLDSDSFGNEFLSISERSKKFAEGTGLSRERSRNLIEASSLITGGAGRPISERSAFGRGLESTALFLTGLISRYGIDPFVRTGEEQVGVTERGDVIVRQTFTGEERTLTGVDTERFEAEQQARRLELGFLAVPTTNIRPGVSPRSQVEVLRGRGAGETASGKGGGVGVGADTQIVRVQDPGGDPLFFRVDTRSRVRFTEGEPVPSVRSESVVRRATDVERISEGTILEPRNIGRRVESSVTPLREEQGVLIAAGQRGGRGGRLVEEGFVIERRPTGEQKAVFDTFTTEPKGTIRTAEDVLRGRIQSRTLRGKTGSQVRDEVLDVMKDEFVTRATSGNLQTAQREFNQILRQRNLQPRERPSLVGDKRGELRLVSRAPSDRPSGLQDIDSLLQAASEQASRTPTQLGGQRTPAPRPVTTRREETPLSEREEEDISPGRLGVIAFGLPPATPRDLEPLAKRDEVDRPQDPRTADIGVTGRQRAALARATAERIRRTRPERLPFDVRERLSGERTSRFQPRRGGVIPETLPEQARERIQNARPEVRPRERPEVDEELLSPNQGVIFTNQNVRRRRGIISRQDDLRSVDIRSRQEISPLQEQEAELGTTQEQEPFQRQRVETEAVQAQQAGQEQVARTRALQQGRTMVTPRTVGTPTPTARTPPTGVPFFPELPDRERTGGELTDVFVRRRGEFVKIADDVPRDAATEILTEELDTTAAASGYLADQEGNRLDVSDVFNGQFRPGKNDAFLVVERRSERLSTPGELSEVTFKGLEKSSFNRGREPRVNFPRGI